MDQEMNNYYEAEAARRDREAQQRKDTLEVTTLSDEEPTAPQGPSSWGGGRDGIQMASWQQPDGFYGCLQGVTGGIWWEGEDQGPYTSRDEVETALRTTYACRDEEEEYEPPEPTEEEMAAILKAMRENPET